MRSHIPLLAASLLGNLVLAGIIAFGPRQTEERQVTQSAEVTAVQDEESADRHPYLSKRIFAENQNDILINFIPLRTALREYVEKQPDPIGVYFEYLPSGTSIGVNDNLKIQLASLVKIPITMGIYRQMEKGELAKSDIRSITEKDVNQRFGNLWQKGVGSTITVEEAIRFTLVNSDNTASNVLLSALPATAIDHVFDSLDVPKNTEGEFHIISPKSYSSILRSLYLSSYLTQASSNEILDILTKTASNDKIPASIPKHIKVAHKIGVFDTINDPEDTYSDCGIVYAPQRPYLLCIMVRADEAKAREHMQHISKMVYGYIVAAK